MNDLYVGHFTEGHPPLIRQNRFVLRYVYREPA
jgi:hypothetical protein